MRLLLRPPAARGAAGRSVTIAAADRCVKLDVDLTVGTNDKVSGTYIIAIDRSLLQLTGQDPDALYQQLSGDVRQPPLPEGASATAEKYDHGNFVGAKITVDDLPIASLNNLGGTAPARAARRQFSAHPRRRPVPLPRHHRHVVVSSGRSPSSACPTPLTASAEIRIKMTFPGEVTETNGDQGRQLGHVGAEVRRRRPTSPPRPRTAAAVGRRRRRQQTRWLIVLAIVAGAGRRDRGAGLPAVPRPSRSGARRRPTRRRPVLRPARLAGTAGRPRPAASGRAVAPTAPPTSTPPAAAAPPAPPPSRPAPRYRHRADRKLPVTPTGRIRCAPPPRRLPGATSAAQLAGELPPAGRVGARPPAPASSAGSPRAPGRRSPGGSRSRGPAASNAGRRAPTQVRRTAAASRKPQIVNARRRSWITGARPNSGGPPHGDGRCSRPRRRRRARRAPAATSARISVGQLQGVAEVGPG